MYALLDAHAVKVELELRSASIFDVINEFVLEADNCIVTENYFRI